MAMYFFQMEPYNNISLIFAGVNNSHIHCCFAFQEVITKTSFKLSARNVNFLSKL